MPVISLYHWSSAGLVLPHRVVTGRSIRDTQYTDHEDYTVGSQSLRVLDQFSTSARGQFVNVLEWFVSVLVPECKMH